MVVDDIDPNDDLSLQIFSRLVIWMSMFYLYYNFDTGR